MTIEPKIPGAVIPRGVFTQSGSKAEYLPNARMSASTGSGHGCALARAALCHKATDAPQQKASLLDQLVGAQQERFGDREAERLSSLEIDEQLNFRGLLDGQISWLFALENPAGIDANPTK